MKRLFIITIVCLIPILVFAGKPPEAVYKAFQQKFPTATNIKWGKESANEWEASFIFNNKKNSANFATDGQWLETETEIGVQELPPRILSEIKQTNKNCKVTGAYIIESVKSGNQYEAEIRKGIRKKEVIYNTDGILVK